MRNDIYEDGYVKLANAIVIHAALDYLKLKKKISEANPLVEHPKLDKQINDIRRFFLGKWYDMLSEADGQTILNKLDRTFEHLKKTNQLHRINSIYAMEGHTGDWLRYRDERTKGPMGKDLTYDRTRSRRLLSRMR